MARNVVTYGAPFTGLTLIPVWIRNHMPSKVWDEITYPFPNFNGCAVDFWKLISDFMPYFIMDAITYPCWDWSLSLFVKEGPGAWSKCVYCSQYGGNKLLTPRTLWSRPYQANRRTHMCFRVRDKTTKRFIDNDKEYKYGCCKFKHPFQKIAICLAFITLQQVISNRYTFTSPFSLIIYTCMMSQCLWNRSKK